MLASRNNPALEGSPTQSQPALWRLAAKAGGLPIANCPLPIEKQPETDDRRPETVRRSTGRSPVSGVRSHAVAVQLAIGNGQLAIRRGFTLLEVILVLVIIAVVATLGVASFWGSMTSQRIKESPIAIATLLKTARSEAALTGKRLTVTFDSATGQPAVSIEGDPLLAPGKFQEYPVWWATQAALPEEVSLVKCELTGNSAACQDPSLPGSAGGEQKFATIMFYPDRSCDNARILLQSTLADDTWAAELDLNGIDGSVSTREFSTADEPIEKD
jgi:prepilin-type N-terminal cleavage/methylation domain-containing protein